MDEEVIHLILKQCISFFVTYEIRRGIYEIKDISDAVYTKGDHKGTVQFEYDDISIKTERNLTRFGSNVGTSRFDEKSFLNNLLGYTSDWEHKFNISIHAASPGV